MNSKTCSGFVDELIIDGQKHKKFSIFTAKNCKQYSMQILLLSNAPIFKAFY
jgi:hypothetical protein